MSFDHKAYSFDWQSFTDELAPILRRALATSDARAIEVFIDANPSACSNPYDGEPLDAEWRGALESGDLQEIADFALTRFYDSTVSRGLSHVWLELEQAAPAIALGPLLGTPFGPSDEALFDPGRMGSYFQSPDDVAATLVALRGVRNDAVEKYASFLRTVVEEQRGLYVTF